MSEKALSETQQVEPQGFSKKDLQSLFDLPTPPPGFDAKSMQELRQRCRSIFEKRGGSAGMGVEEAEQEALAPLTAATVPAAEQRKPSSANEALLASLQSASCIASSAK